MSSSRRRSSGTFSAPSMCFSANSSGVRTSMSRAPPFTSARAFGPSTFSNVSAVEVVGAGAGGGDEAQATSERDSAQKRRACFIVSRGYSRRGPPAMVGWTRHVAPEFSGARSENRRPNSDAKSVGTAYTSAKSALSFDVDEGGWLPLTRFLVAWANAPYTVALGIVGLFALLSASGLLGLLAGGEHGGGDDGDGADVDGHDVEGHEADHDAGDGDGDDH